MLKRAIALATAVLFVTGAAFAGTPKKIAKTVPAKVVEVTICPITLEGAMGAGGGTEKVGKYNVHFCCPMCKPQFDKLSAKDKQTKISAALKKQNAPKKKA